MKERILVFCDFYLPGFKSGGGMWTVVNLVDRFADRYDFYVVTRNYESKGDRTPYTSVRSSAWNTVGNAQVFYLSETDYKIEKIAALVADIRPKIIFLNSAFSLPVIRFLNARRKKLTGDSIPVVLAPCGEMSAGALSVKPLKKKLFLAYTKTVNLYKDVFWKASSEAELNDIRKVIGNKPTVMVASDLAPKSVLPEFEPHLKPLKTEGTAKFIIFARITGMKNIHFALERFAGLKEGKAEIEIVGPVEDELYWKRCLSIANSLPSNVLVNSNAEFVPQEVGLQRMQDSHFFILPTLGENFGYAFIEAMAAGCPLVVSDRTGWKDLEERNAGWQISLDDKELWIRRIEQCIRMGEREYKEMSANARRYATDWLASDVAERSNAVVFETALKQGRVIPA